LNTEFAAKNPDAVRGFFRAQQRALDYMFDHKEETAKIWIRRAEMKIPEAAVLRTWDYYNRAAMTLKTDPRPAGDHRRRRKEQIFESAAYPGGDQQPDRSELFAVARRIHRGDAEYAKKKIP